MANYQLGPVIGKIGGGADVQVTPVDVEAGGDYNNSVGRVEITRVTVPEGETHLITLIGSLTGVSYVGNASPILWVGGNASTANSGEVNPASVSAVISGPADVPVDIQHRGSGPTPNRITGHVYVVPLPD